MTLIRRLDYKGIYTQKMHLLRLTELNAALPAEYVYPVHCVTTMSTMHYDFLKKMAEVWWRLCASLVSVWAHFRLDEYTPGIHLHLYSYGSMLEVMEKERYRGAFGARRKWFLYYFLLYLVLLSYRRVSTLLYFRPFICKLIEFSLMFRSKLNKIAWSHVWTGDH